MLEASYSSHVRHLSRTGNATAASFLSFDPAHPGKLGACAAPLRASDQGVHDFVQVAPGVRQRLAHVAREVAHQSAAAAEGDRLGKALELYAGGWEKAAAARLEQDAAITQNFLFPWQTTLNQAISVAMKARQAVRVSRLELDAAKQSYVVVHLASVHASVHACH